MTDGETRQSDTPEPVTQLRPLVVSGLVVSKAELLAVLRVYVPALTDLTPLDGDRFLLHVAPPETGAPDPGDERSGQG